HHHHLHSFPTRRSSDLSDAACAMSFIVPEDIEGYAEAHTTPPTQLLTALSGETRDTLVAPQMLTGPIEGRFLEFLVYALTAKREIGRHTSELQSRSDLV